MANPRFDVWNVDTEQWQVGSEAHLILFPNILKREKPGTKTTDTHPLSGSTTKNAPAAGDTKEKE